MSLTVFVGKLIDSVSTVYRIHLFLSAKKREKKVSFMIPFADSIEFLKYLNPVFSDNRCSIRESLEYCLPYSI
jgi:hypothetical protein